MPIISRDSIEEIRNRVSLLDIVEPYVSLKRSGSSYKGLSPFNNEKTPSFYVHPDKGFFKCFSSGEGGDMFKFVQLMENLDFQEAVEHIANRFGIQLQYESGGPSEDTRSLRAQLFDIYTHACGFFHQELLAQNKDAASMRHYWKEERSFSSELAKEYKVGYAPTDTHALLSSLKQKDFKDEAIIKSGLFYGEYINRLKPRFRGRLMIPIRDIQGRVIAFTARQTALTPQDHDVEKSKYINSPETAIFIKKNMLFNLDRARVPAGKLGRFILVEGQLDAMRCFEKGIEHAVAPQGSGISLDQMRLLKRYAEGLDCLLDGDRAGLDAAMRLIPIALQSDLHLRLLTLPEGADPDDLLRDQGLDALKSLESRAQSPVEFVVSRMLPNPHKADSRQKSDALRRVFEIITVCESSIARDDMLAELSRFAAADRSSVEQDFERFQKSRQASFRPVEAQIAQNSAGLLTIVAERLLLLVLHSEEAREFLAQNIDPEWLSLESESDKLLNRFLAAQREGLWPETEDIGELIENDEENKIVYKLLAHEAENEPIKQAQIDMLELYTSFYEQRQKELELKLNNMPTDDLDVVAITQRELIEVRRAKQNPPFEFA